jgi:hypothetical protein
MKTINLTLKLSVLVLIFCNTLFGQDYKVKWGPLEKNSGQMRAIIPKNDHEFFTLRRSGRGGLLSSLQLASHKDLSMKVKAKLKLKVNDQLAAFEDAYVIGGKLFIFLSDKQKTKNILYMQEYGSDVMPKGKAVKLAEYDIEKGRGSDFFMVLESDDHGFFGIVWEKYNKKLDKQSYGYHIYDDNINSISEGEYTLPGDGSLTDIEYHYLSNSGDYFIAISEYEEVKSGKKIFKRLNLKGFHISQVTPDGLIDFNINLEDKKIMNVTMSSDNEKTFTLTGTYGEDGKSGTSGVYYIRFNFNKQELIDQGFKEFGKDFITQDWSERKKNKADKKEAKGKGSEPTLYSYKLRKAEVLKDGSFIATLEQYYVVQHTYTDPKTGATRTTYTYYYNDIIAYKVGVSGEFDWLVKIDKRQVSTNDGGYYSSYRQFVDNGKLYMIFNDNIKNYKENGEFDTKLDNVESARLSKRKNAVAIVGIDLESGNVNRETLLKTADIGAIVVPKKFIVDQKSHQVTLYSVRGKKESYGIIKLKD